MPLLHFIGGLILAICGMCVIALSATAIQVKDYGFGLSLLGFIALWSLGMWLSLL